MGNINQHTASVSPNKRYTLPRPNQNQIAALSIKVKEGKEMLNMKPESAAASHFNVHDQQGMQLDVIKAMPAGPLELLTHQDQAVSLAKVGQEMGASPLPTTSIEDTPEDVDTRGTYWRFRANEAIKNLKVRPASTCSVDKRWFVDCNDQA